MNGIHKFVLVCAAACLMAGCSNQNPSTSGNAASPDASELTAQAKPYIPDVPMPLDFRYIDDKSGSSAAPGVRMIYHVYRGPKDKFEVARFFRKQMPLSGWQIKTETDAQGVKTMEYGKEAETCRIFLQDGPMFDKTEVRVQIFPSGSSGRTIR